MKIAKGNSWTQRVIQAETLDGWQDNDDDGGSLSGKAWLRLRNLKKLVRLDFSMCFPPAGQGLCGFHQPATWSLRGKLCNRFAGHASRWHQLIWLSRKVSLKAKFPARIDKIGYFEHSARTYLTTHPLAAELADSFGDLTRLGLFQRLPPPVHSHHASA